MEKYLQQVIEGVSNTHGEDFFNAITLQLASIIGSDYTFIARLDLKAYVSRTIALAQDQQIIDNFEYSLEYTPCANVADNSVCVYAKDVTRFFPQDQLLIDMGIEGYLGTPLHNANNEVIGLIVALYKSDIKDSKQTQTLFEIFSGRIAAEMDRIDQKNKLIEFNNTLEQRVIERTASLHDTLEELKSTQDQLIESEKFAALGNLVASVAHEVNTPLGVAITGQSLLTDAFDQLKLDVNNGALTKEAMNEYLALNSETLPLVSDNLERAKILINNFKNTAADQSINVAEEIHLSDYYQKLLSTLKPMMKRKGLVFQLNIDEDLKLETTPGIHGQILTNLVSNSVKHGYPHANSGTVTLTAKQQDDQVIILYSDDGCGLTEEARQKIFQPFYTTSRGAGGTGLGMAITYNLIKQKLKGELRLLESDQGFALEISLPLIS